MTVKVVFKGVTYESLKDPKFMELAKKAIPELETLYQEYEAARAAANREEQAEGEGRNEEEVDSDDVSGTGGQKGAPGWRGPG